MSFFRLFWTSAALQNAQALIRESDVQWNSVYLPLFQALKQNPVCRTPGCFKWVFDGTLEHWNVTPIPTSGWWIVWQRDDTHRRVVIGKFELMP